ncbi:MAG TPA: DUF72 domain-containing protein [Saprospiraceae bacterium]|nr:DUF72 domain-containing protein [Saprospiraceae bacterium]HPI08271.1 DUF72 domain-containing protein [Saprospiraceae bacterium]
MKFAKLPSVDHVDFSLPPEPPQNEEVLAALPRPAKPHIYIGGTGYNVKHWVGSLYPFGAKDRDFLRYYGTQFNTIEHNTTHYRIPDAATVARWKEETPADFRYCPKIPQTISHARDLGIYSGLIPVFCEAIKDLDGKMGCCFMQLPPHFTTKELPLLQRFIERWDPQIPLAIEARHESFFEPTVDAETFFQMLQENNMATVITDVAGRRDVCHMRLTNRRVLVRFVGNELHPSDYERVEAWSERLHFWLEAGLHEVYFFTHEPDDVLVPELAEFTLKTFLEEMPDVDIRGPKKVGGQQGSLF